MSVALANDVAPNPIVECGENGVQSAERWSPAFYCSLEDLAVIKLRVDAGQLELQNLPDNSIRVAGLNYCGLVRLPSGCTVRITSKVPSVETLKWLVYTGRFQELDVWSDTPHLTHDDSIAECIVKLFVAELRKVTLFHMRPGYTRTARVRQIFRGRLNERALSASVARLPGLPCLYRDRTMDTLQNRVLSRALDAAMHLVPAARLDNTTRAYLGWLSLQWSDIERSLPSLTQALSQALMRPPIGYRTALTLARILLLGAGFDLIGGEGGDCFLVDMSKLWEESLRVMLGRWCKHSGWTEAGTKDRTRPWDDALADEERNRWLTADAIASDPSFEENAVLDAKYKCAYEQESRNDRFQMAAYALAFGAKRVILVYPSAADRSFRHRLLLTSRLEGGEATIHSLELPMAAGPKDCECAALNAFDQLVLER